jgi:hypothetical protein
VAKANLGDLKNAIADLERALQLGLEESRAEAVRALIQRARESLDF